MQRKATARLSDVARAAGVSLSTASRALADPQVVREDTRAAVCAAAERLGYVPHGAARALASRRSMTIGAVVPTLDNPIFARSTQALQRSLADAGYTLLLGSHDYNPSTELAVVRALVARGVDGLVLVGTDHSPEVYALIVQSGIPFELTWSIDATGPHYAVGFSNRLAAVQVAQYVCQAGHQHIAMLSGFMAHNDRARDRVAGVREACAAAGRVLPGSAIIETAFSIAAARSATRQLLSAAQVPSAILCGNDILAIGVLLECAAQGVSVPKQLSVVGFDDIEMAAEMAPALTTLHVPTAQIGQRAAERLVARLQGESVARTEAVPVRLIVRESSAAPAVVRAK